MHRSRRFLLLGSLLMVVCSLFAMVPMGTAFAAPTSPHVQAAPMATSSCPPEVSESTPPNNTWVQALQFYLNGSLGEELDVDGTFGSNTLAAVKAEQKRFNIPQDGIVGNQSWSAFGFCMVDQVFDGHVTGATDRAICPPTQSENASGNTMIYVQALQGMLNAAFLRHTNFSRSGFTFPLATDGQFGPQTKAAVVDYQNAVGISGGNGVVGQRTWSELTMCFS